MLEVALCLLIAWIIVAAFSKPKKGKPFAGIFWPTKKK